MLIEAEAYHVLDIFKFKNTCSSGLCSKAFNIQIQFSPTTNKQFLFIFNLVCVLRKDQIKFIYVHKSVANIILYDSLQ